MLQPWQQAEFRPLVARAWQAQCEATGRNPKNRQARDAWYREQLWAAAHISSSKAAGLAEFNLLIRWFSAQTSASDRLIIVGFSDRQNHVCRTLVAKAWRTTCRRGSRDGLDFRHWVDVELESCGVTNRTALLAAHTRCFDRVISHFAIIAGDRHWIDRTSEAPEIRMRYQIDQLLSALSHLQHATVSWDYIRGIYDQAHLLPADIRDAPASTLWRILQMLSTHVRRLCKQAGVRKADLPQAQHVPF